MGGSQALAFGLVAASGAATFLGAIGVLFNKSRLDTSFLSVAMAASAGVMIYVSFVEIFSQKSTGYFVDSGMSEAHARRYSSLLFFAGILCTVILDKLSHLLAGNCGGSYLDSKGEGKGNTGASAASEGEVAPELKTQDLEVNLKHQGVEKGDEAMSEESEEKLQKAGLITALAIGLHNFPEGLATYMATLADSSAGIAVAVAIALHNIPEGLAVSMPVYYGTGSKKRGILWGTISGMSEPLGALVGYLILKGTDMSPMTYGVLFALVAGMMVYISFAELLPMAFTYGDSNQVSITVACFFGMGVMSASLLLFEA